MYLVVVHFGNIVKPGFNKCNKRKRQFLAAMKQEVNNDACR